MKFIDPKHNVAFQKIFGSSEHKNVLISFLNAVLGLEGEYQIEDVSIANSYQIPKIEGLKDTTLDVKATDVSGRSFIVEMQVRDQKNFKKRSLYYTSKAYVQQLGVRDQYHLLKPVIFIGILNFKIFADSEHYLSRHWIANRATGKQSLDDFEFNFIELPKFKKHESELEGVMDEWIYFLKKTPTLNMIPPDTSPIVAEAYHLANQHQWTERELEIYERTSHDYAEEEAIKEELRNQIEEARAQLEDKRVQLEEKQFNFNTFLIQCF